MIFVVVNMRLKFGIKTIFPYRPHILDKTSNHHLPGDLCSTIDPTNSTQPTQPNSTSIHSTPIHFCKLRKPPTSKHPSLGIKLKIEPKGEGFGTSVAFFHQGKTLSLISWDPLTKTHQKVLETHQNSENWAPNQAKLDILRGWRGATLIKIASGIPSCTTWRSWTSQKIRYLPYLKRNMVPQQAVLFC